MKTLLTFLLLTVAASVCDAQWVQTNGPYGGDISCLVVSGTNLFAGTLGGGVFRSTNNGTSWTQVNAGLPSSPYVSALAVSDTNLFVGIYGGAFLSTNNGTSWTAAGLVDSAVSALFTSGTNLFAGTLVKGRGRFGNGVFYSTNQGASWIKLSASIPIFLGVGSFATIGTNIFFGSWDCDPFCDGGVYLSTNNGVGWDVALQGRGVVCLVVMGTNIIAGEKYGGVLWSTNNGTNWSEVNSGLPTARSVTSISVSGRNIFAGFDTFGDSAGVYLSTNDGASWVAVNSGLTNRKVVSLATSGTHLFAGTKDSVVWRRPLSEMITNVNSSDALPQHFLLEQNYPNPFNPTTEIRYQIPEVSHVTLKVFDILGREVVTLVNEVQEAGFKSAKWDASGVASGVYFYRLQTGNFVGSRKLVVLK